MKIKFNSDDDLPLNKPLKFRLMAIRSVFEENGKLYSQVFLQSAAQSFETFQCFTKFSFHHK